MSWVTALRDFSWKPTAHTTIDFRKGDKYNMPKEAAEKLIAEGKVRSSSKGKNNGDGDTVDTATVDHAIEASEGGENTPEEGSASSAGASSIGAAQGGGTGGT